MKKHCCLWGIALLVHQTISAQFADSLSIHAGINVTAATKPYQPLWHIANQFGTVEDRQADPALHFKLTNRHDFGKSVFLTPDSSVRNFTLRYGFDLYNNNYLKSTFFKEAYVRLAYRNLEVRAGRIAEVVGEIDPSLSSGSLGVSGNALPIPQVGLKLHYVDVPLTKGWVQLKGEFSHGWFGKENDVRNSYLHHKSAYLKFGKNNLQFYAGLNHFAQWGGIHPAGPMPGKFKDFLRIVAARSGKGGGSDYRQGAGGIDTANGVGNHIIIPDFGLVFRNGGNRFTLYTQNIFDKGRADSANQRDELDALRILGKDHLVGFKWERAEKKLLQAIAAEYIYTKSQGGPVQFWGRDDYYNNAVFTTGWQYKDRIIGTPLFLRREDAAAYGLNLQDAPLDSREIVSNRISGLHVAARGHISQKVFYRVMATHVRHFGNYYNDDVFSSGKSQNHLLIEGGCLFLGMIKVTASVGQDFGDTYHTTGARLSIDWQLY